MSGVRRRDRRAPPSSSRATYRLACRDRRPPSSTRAACRLARRVWSALRAACPECGVRDVVVMSPTETRYCVANARIEAIRSRANDRSARRVVAPPTDRQNRAIRTLILTRRARGGGVQWVQCTNGTRYTKVKVDRYFEILAERVGDLVPMAIDLYLVQARYHRHSRHRHSRHRHSRCHGCPCRRRTERADAATARRRAAPRVPRVPRVPRCSARYFACCSACCPACCSARSLFAPRRRTEEEEERGPPPRRREKTRDGSRPRPLAHTPPVPTYRSSPSRVRILRARRSTLGTASTCASRTRRTRFRTARYRGQRLVVEEEEPNPRCYSHT